MEGFRPTSETENPKLPQGGSGTGNFTNYAKIKDSCCICYFGDLTDHIIDELLSCKSKIEKSYPGLKVTICCRDDSVKYIKSIPKSELNRDNFLFVEEIPAVPGGIAKFQLPHGIQL